MTLAFIESHDSRKVTGGPTDQRLRRKWTAFRHLNHAIVRAALLLEAGTSFDGLPRGEYDADPLGSGVWSCWADYSLRVPESPANTDDDEALGPAYSVDMTAGTAHITQSIRTVLSRSAGTNLTMHPSTPGLARPEGTLTPTADDVGKQVTITGGSMWSQNTYTIDNVIDGYWVLSGSPAAVGATGGKFWTTAAPDYRQAICVSQSGVAGTDIYVPKSELNMTTKAYPITMKILRQRRAIVAKTNDAPWRGFELDELLYLGGTLQCEANSIWTLNDKFAMGENKTDLQVTPELKVDKKAWEFLWCTYMQANINGLVLQVPRSVYVEQVYHNADFNKLNLNPPICEWTASPIGGMHPLTVQFTDLSSGTPLVWLWTFGDGTTSALKNPLKVYAIPGTYTVSLTVTNGAGQSFKTVINAIIVS